MLGFSINPGYQKPCPAVYSQIFNKVERMQVWTSGVRWKYELDVCLTNLLSLSSLLHSFFSPPVILDLSIFYHWKKTLRRFLGLYLFFFSACEIWRTRCGGISLWQVLDEDGPRQSDPAVLILQLRSASMQSSLHPLEVRRFQLDLSTGRIPQNWQQWPDLFSCMELPLSLMLSKSTLL